MPAFPSKLPFGAFLAYAPRGSSTASKTSRDVAYAIKQDSTLRFTQGGAPAAVRVIDYAAKRIGEELRNHPFLNDYFNPSVTLIPVPRSSPTQPGTLWPSLRICQALIAQGLCGNVKTSLQRTKPVQKSAFAAPGQRPEPADHYDTVEVAPADLFTAPQAITLIDDVVTRGSTFVGLYQRLREAFPAVPIRCFAVVRTVSPGEVASILDPVQGTITLSGSGLHRQP